MKKSLELKFGKNLLLKDSYRHNPRVNFIKHLLGAPKTYLQFYKQIFGGLNTKN